MRHLSLLALALLAGCATAPPPAPVAPPPPPGMEQLLGKPAEVALELLGKPRIDKREGDARQLQFASGCVLDIWYYAKPGPTPVATHADARLADGRDFAPGDCLQMLIRAKSPPVITPTPAPVTKLAPGKKPASARKG
jgi:hypothetical protein